MPYFSLIFTILFGLAIFPLCQAEGQTDRFSTAQVCKAVRKCTKDLDNGRECSVIPAPERSVLSSPGPLGFKLTMLRHGVWLYEDLGYQSMFIKSGRRLIALDLPDSANSRKLDGSKTRLTDAAEQILGPTIPKRIDIVFSHAHFDHIGASPRFKSYMEGKYPGVKVVVWGTSEVRELLANSVTKRAINPDIIVGKEGKTLRIRNGLEVRMSVIGGHTDNDLLMHIPRHKDEPGIVMHVDSAYPGWAPPFDLGVTLNVGKYISAHREILNLDFDIFVGGHTKAGSKTDVRRNLNYTEDLVRAAQQGLQLVTPQDLAEAGIGRFTNPNSLEYGNLYFALVGIQRKLNIDKCYRIIFPKWGCALAGLDYVLRSHCLTALAYLLTDY